MENKEPIIMTEKTSGELRNHLTELKFKFYSDIKAGRDHSVSLSEIKSTENLLRRAVIGEEKEGTVGNDTIVSLTTNYDGKEENWSGRAKDCCFVNEEESILSLQSPLGKAIRGLEPGQNAEYVVGGKRATVTVNSVMSLEAAIDQEKKI
ncbi:MAG: hypothetical protein PHS45_02330 [Bacilli bacterium]|nr:hypothetical protein [Bacilli bacterium]